MNGDVHFRCTNKKCSVSVYTNTSMDSATKRVGVHNHDPYNLQNIVRDEIRTAVKRKADEDLHVRPNKIIRHEVKKNYKSDVLAYKDFQLLRHAAYQVRRKKLPTLPGTLDDAIRQLTSMADSILHKNEKFCFVYKSIPILTTAKIYVYYSKLSTFSVTALLKIVLVISNNFTSYIFTRWATTYLLFIV